MRTSVIAIAHANGQTVVDDSSVDRFLKDKRIRVSTDGTTWQTSQVVTARFAPFHEEPADGYYFGRINFIDDSSRRVETVSPLRMGRLEIWIEAPSAVVLGP